MLTLSLSDYFVLIVEESMLSQAATEYQFGDISEYLVDNSEPSAVDVPITNLLLNPYNIDFAGTNPVYPDELYVLKPDAFHELLVKFSVHEADISLLMVFTHSCYAYSLTHSYLLTHSLITRICIYCWTSAAMNLSMFGIFLFHFLSLLPLVLRNVSRWYSLTHSLTH